MGCYVAEDLFGQLKCRLSGLSATGKVSDRYGYQLRRGRWISPGELAGTTPAFDDCDGDGVDDNGYGELCRRRAQWWAPVGKRVCAEDGNLVCAAEPAEVKRHRSYFMPGPWTMEADLDRGVVYLMGWDWVDVVRVARNVPPARVARLRLDGVGFDMVRNGERLYVGSDEGIEVFNVGDLAAPAKEGVLPTGSAVYEVASAGGRLLVFDDGGVKVLRSGAAFGDPPVVVGEIPIEELEADEQWLGWSFGFVPPGRLASAGHLGFLAGEAGIWVLDLEDREAPIVAQYVPTGPCPGALRVANGVVYASGQSNTRLDIRETEPVVGWGHEVRPWVIGRALEHGVAVRLESTGLGIVELRNPQ